MSFVRLQTDHLRFAIKTPTASGAAKRQDMSSNTGVLRCIPPFTAQYELSRRQLSILTEIAGFFTHERLCCVLCPLIDQTCGISLRSLDWLVTNFSKRHNIVIRRDATNGDHRQHGNLFNIYNEYRSSLAYFRRRNFDPFRRRLRIAFDANGKKYTTTVGQLNFVKWAYENGVLDYAISNSAEIEKDMNSTTSRKASESASIPRNKRRRELSRAPTRLVNIYHVPSTR